MHEIVRLDQADLADEELAALLVDTVEDGASIGFLGELSLESAIAWWQGYGSAVADGRLLVWVARDGAKIDGTIQLKPELTPNGRHRAEIAKLMVHRRARGQGLARQLLATAETAAAEAGFTLLILDTETASPAEGLYRKTGWTEAGTIPAYAATPDGTVKPTTFYYKVPDQVEKSG